MMVLPHIGGTDPAIGPAPAPVVQRQDDGLQNRQWRFDSSPACVFPVRGRATPSAAPSHRTAGRTGPVRPRIGSLPFAFVAQRIGRPPPEREATGSNPVEGTRVRAVTRPVPRGRVTRTHGPAPTCPGVVNGQHSGLPCRRSGFESRPGLEAASARHLRFSVDAVPNGGVPKRQRGSAVTRVLRLRRFESCRHHAVHDCRPRRPAWTTTQDDSVGYPTGRRKRPTG